MACWQLWAYRKLVGNDSHEIMNTVTTSLEQARSGGLRTQGRTRRSAPGKPLVTVVTVVFNGAGTLEHAIKSVISQDYDNIEYIVVDGGSSDGTLEIINRYSDSIDYWVSARDSGIYDAMNKGIGLASGEVIGFINADDFYSSPAVVGHVAEVFKDANVDACYGDLCYVRQDDVSALVRYWRSSDFMPGSFKRGWCPPHPTFFVRRGIYERLGNFDLGFKLAADVELMMRFLEVHRIRTIRIPEVLVKMRMGGATNRSFANILRQNREILRALRQHGLPSSLVSLLGSKLISRGRQFVVRPPSMQK